jgi:hypothetical protein
MSGTMKRKILKGYLVKNIQNIKAECRSGSLADRRLKLNNSCENISKPNSAIFAELWLLQYYEYFKISLLEK